eukprot:COSAG03_NODE_1775_length_3540_cov_2.571927_3_plen_111_part_00
MAPIHPYTQVKRRRPPARGAPPPRPSRMQSAPRRTRARQCVIDRFSAVRRPPGPGVPACLLPTRPHHHVAYVGWWSGVWGGSQDSMVSLPVLFLFCGQVSGTFITADLTE